jgi:hypothetical protein
MEACSWPQTTPDKTKRRRYEEGRGRMLFKMENLRYDWKMKGKGGALSTS